VLIKVPRVVQRTPKGSAWKAPPDDPGRSAGCRVLRQDDPAEVVLSGIPRKQGINAPASFDKCIFPCDGLSRSPASGLGDNLTHG
jgi:hypothetical protein